MWEVDSHTGEGSDIAEDEEFPKSNVHHKE